MRGKVRNMTYEEASGFIKNAEHYGSVLGLESMSRLLLGLGNPQNRLKFVHIAGTNGKGSTTAFITGILAEAGFRIGRYISPAVLSYFEKIQITWKGKSDPENVPAATKYITREEIAEYIDKIRKVCEAMVSEGLPHPTVFEIETAMAMLHFLKKQCDIIVLEVGLGGRLDATNVITTTVCSVITSISMDHMQILGNTIEQIAAEKAGIIKPGIPVVTYDQDGRAMEVIKKTSIQNEAALTAADFREIRVKVLGIGETVFSYKNSTDLKIKLLGENQVRNAIVAILTAEVLRNRGYKISDENIRTGLFHTSWRGRFEIIKENPFFIIDGAHNEDAAISLAHNIHTYFGDRKRIFILGVLADKDYEAILKYTAPLADRIYTITPRNTRGLDAHVLSETAVKYCSQAVDAGSVSKAVRQAFEAAAEEDVIIAFGSLSYLHEIYEVLGVAMP